MYHLKFRFFSQPRLTAVVLVTCGLGLVVACSSDSNPEPSGPPVINTGGGGSGGKGSAGESSAGDSSEAGSPPAQGGAVNPSGGSAGDLGDAGEAGTAGAAGAPPSGGSGPVPATCPASDLGFYNQPSASQKSVFDDVKRLGSHASLPKLPGT